MPTKRTTGPKRSRNPERAPVPPSVSTEATQQFHADLALAVAVEALAEGRDVLWLGGESEGVERLRGSARSVQHLLRAGEENATASSLADPAAALSSLTGQHDLVVVPDAGRAGLLSRSAIAQLRRATADSGVLVIGTESGAELDYESFFALLGEDFRQTRMFGQAAFRGWSMVDFQQAADGAVDVVLDGSAVPPAQDAPSRFFAVCTDRNEPTTDLPLDGYVVVRVPEEATAVPTAKPDDADRNEELWKAAAKRAEELEQTVAARSAELAAVREQLANAQANLSPAPEEPKAVRESAPVVETPATASPRKSNGQGIEAFAEEYAHLERELFIAANALKDTRAEVERRGVLVRDLVERLNDAGSVPTTSGSGPLLERAVQAESKRAEAEFRADELAAELKAAQGASTATTNEPTVRALEAREVELTELLHTAEGRLALANSDLAAARAETLTLKRSLQEAEERLELSLVRERGRSSGSEEAKSTGTPNPELQGQLDALRTQLAEREAALTEVQFGADRAKRQKAELEQSLEAARKRLAERTDETNELRSRLSLADRQVVELTTERDLNRARSSVPAADKDRDAREETQLKAFQEAEGKLRVVQDELDLLREEIEQLRTTDTEKTVRLADAEELSELEAGRAADLAAAVAARDALVNRLQVDLAGFEQSERDADQQITRMREENERLRDALMSASDRVDHIESIEAKLAEVEAALQESESGNSAQSDLEDRLKKQVEQDRITLENLSASLKSLLERVGPTGSAISSSATSIDVDPPAVESQHPQADLSADAAAEPSTLPSGTSDNEIAVLRRWISAMEREAEDRETLLRSVTAQLEDRDDRIQALERRLSESGGGAKDDTETLRRELLELRERASRLAEELLSERRARQSGAPSQGDAEAREAELADCRRHGASLDRDLKSLRAATAKARAGLSELMGQAAASGDSATKERIALLLKVLGS